MLVNKDCHAAKFRYIFCLRFFFHYWITDETHSGVNLGINILIEIISGEIIEPNIMMSLVYFYEISK